MSNEQIEEFYAFLSERMAAKAKLTIAPGPQTVPHSPDRRLNDVSDGDIERLHKAMLRGLERRLARLGARPHKGKARRKAAAGSRPRKLLQLAECAVI